MTWNYRVCKAHVRHRMCPELDQDWYTIHETYYDEDGTPTHITEHPVTVEGEGLDEIRQDLEWMLKALDKPVLDRAFFDPDVYALTPEQEAQRAAHDPATCRICVRMAQFKEIDEETP